MMKLAPSLLPTSITAAVALLLGPATFAEEAPAPATVLITGSKIFDGSNETLITGKSVLIEGNVIKSIAVDIKAPEGATVINADGKVLMPGLIDCHWHTYYAYCPQSVLVTGDISEVAIYGFLGAEKTLMRGFTTIRDVGGNPYAVKKMVDTGEHAGPRMYISGPPISQTSGHFDFRGKNDVPANSTDPLSYWERNSLIMTADGVDEVIKRSRENLRQGATQLKIAGGGGVSSSYDPIDVQEYTFEEMKAFADVAATWNTYVAAHIFTDKAIQTAVKAGIKSIEHGMLIEKRETLELMKKHGAWLSIQPLLDDEDALKFDSPASTEKWIQVTSGTDSVYKMAKEIGVKTAFGTDMLFDPATADKQGKLLAKLTRWYTPYEILKMATHDNAELVKMCGPRDPYPGVLGVVKEGALADLILVDGNPLEDINLVVDPAKNFVVIMKDGKVYKNTIE